MNISVRKVIIYIALTVILASLIPLVFIYTTKKQQPSVSNQTPTNKEKLILGFSQIGSESAWRSRNTESIFEAAEANDIQILFDDAQQKQENQLKAIRSFIVYQVDVIAFVPIVEDGWDNVLQEAKEAGIPVILVDRQINTNSDLYAGFLGEDGNTEGKLAAEYLVKKCADKENKINILEFSGTANSSVVRKRAEGFRDVIKDYPKFEIIHSEDGDFLRSRGKEIMDRILLENQGLFINEKPIDVIYSHNDSMTLGILDSFEKNNISPDDVIIISIDGEQKSIDALTQGKLNCVVECNPNLGPLLMNLIKDVAEGKEIPPVTYMNETVFTEDDDFSQYTPRGY
ncbi:MAG: ABC transporter substrate-binding protein [Treponema sp.]|nr:ABC transporter substrate-binding protein [Treponema sp.]